MKWSRAPRGATAAAVGGTAAAEATIVRGHLDAPLADASVQPVVFVAGWAFSTQAPIVRAEVLVTGASIGTLQVGLPRPDVAAAHEALDAGPACGFGGEVSLAGLENGPLRLVVRIVDAAGNSLELERDVARLSILLHIDEPRPGCVPGGPLPVGGWAFDTSGEDVSVEVRVDGEPAVTLPLGVPRPDVARRHAHPAAERCGFWGVVPAELVPLGPHRLEFVATSARDEAVSFAVPIRVTGPDEPVAAIEVAWWRDELVHVEGWAVWPRFRPPILARAFLGAEPVAVAGAGLSRPDVAWRFPGLPDAVRSGFRLEGPGVLGGDGPVELRVELENRDGQRLARSVHVRSEGGEGGRDATAIRAALAPALVALRAASGGSPTFLDWRTGLHLAQALPTETVVTPPDEQAATLPYLEGSIDAVVLATADPAAVAEARQVARHAVVTVSADPVAAAAAPALAVTVEWLDGPRDARPVQTLPTATVVIPVHDRMDLTATCLTRLGEVSPGDPLVEIVVVDDASAEDTTAALREWGVREPRLRVMRQESNQGFVASSNRGAAEARGEVLVFLNNDTAPEPGWLEALLETLARDVTVGAVGGKLLYPDGTLQEAGSVVFCDGSACNFGRGDFEPDAPLYSFAREVDYCSGALLATRADVFRAVGGFDTRFAPAYFEDTDFCLSVWARGLRVVYQPAARVVHLEGGSHGTDETSGLKRFQAINQGKFVEKWAAVLKTHLPRPRAFDATALYTLAFRTWGERPK